MNKILVPIDFSAASQNVLTYVAALTHDMPTTQVTVLKSYVSSIAEQIFPAADFYAMVDTESIDVQNQAIREHVRTFISDFLKQVAPGVKVEIGVSEEPLLRSINDLTREHKYNVLIMSSDKADEEDNYVAEQVISVVKASTIPVLVVPPKAVYQPLRKALIPVDFKALHRLTALNELFTLRTSLKPELTLLNIAGKPKDEQTDPVVETRLHELIHDQFPYSLVVSPNKDVLQGILDFSQQNEFQLVVALKGQYSFLNNLTHRSITEALTLNAYHPVLVLK